MADKKQVLTDNKRKYNVKYKAEHLKRIPLDVQICEYKKLKDCANKSGESVNGYIKKAVKMRMDSDIN